MVDRGDLELCRQKRGLSESSKLFRSFFFNLSQNKIKINKCMCKGSVSSEGRDAKRDDEILWQLDTWTWGIGGPTILSTTPVSQLTTISFLEYGQMHRVN